EEVGIGDGLSACLLKLDKPAQVQYVITLLLLTILSIHCTLATDGLLILKLAFRSHPMVISFLASDKTTFSFENTTDEIS
ncbi:12968_t:CDS:2, partial [Entrophospora sp. SA101]